MLGVGLSLPTLMFGLMVVRSGMRSLVSLVVWLGCLHCLLVLVGSIVLGDIWICFHLIMVLELEGPDFIFLFKNYCRRCREPSFGESSLLSRLQGPSILGLIMLMWLVMLVGFLAISKVKGHADVGFVRGGRFEMQIRLVMIWLMKLPILVFGGLGLR